jgi:hypothetical protein
VLADALPPPIPDTPGGRALRAWLDTLNSGDSARLESFLKAFPSNWTMAEMVRWSAETGGYDLLEIYANDQTNVFFRVVQRSRAVEEFGRMQLSVTDPASLTALDVRRIPTGAKIEPLTLNDAARAKVIAQVVSILDRFHVDPKIGKVHGSAEAGGARRLSVADVWRRLRKKAHPGPA